MADPRRQASREAAGATGSFARRRIPVDRPAPEPAPPAGSSGVEAGAPAAPEEPELVIEELPAEEIVIGPDPSERSDAEIRELTDSLVRLQAEFDNYRKRQAREFRRLSSQGRRELVAELLAVLDNFDRAENHRASSEDPPQELAEGLFRTVDQMRRILAQFGLSDLDVRSGDPFDPNIHDAVQAQEVDGLARDSVLEIFQKGYLFDQELLRPAMVRVGKAVHAPVEPPAEEVPAPPPEAAAPPVDVPPAGADGEDDDDMEIEYEGEWGPDRA